MAKIKKKMLWFFLNLGTSGKFSEKRAFKTSDYLIRYVLLNFIIIIGAAVLPAFIIRDIKTGLYPNAVACSVMLLIGAAVFFIARTGISQIIPSTVLMVFYGLLCVMLTWIGEVDGANFVLIYLYPLVTIMLLGIRVGIVLSSILLVAVGAQMCIPGLSGFSYPFDMAVRMMASYLLVFSVMIVIESTRRAKDRFMRQQGLRLHELREKAESANHTKSAFLAGMSHEMRTPMNTIIGMAELLLRGELSEEGRSCVRDIKQATSNLLSIINNLLDLSKIETGRLKIIPTRYFLSSLITDVVGIIRMWIMEKPVRFLTNIDSRIPNCLIGDESRVRQVLLNLLTNAAKYTERGNISVMITQDGPRVGNRLRLKVVVTDSGIGIKPEDRGKLFGEFIHMDTVKNRGIEGAGLGLPISKRLCALMGGDITVDSKYGKGSVFTAFIPQEIGDEAPFASVPEAGQKKVLVYEGRKVYADSVCWSLENMGIPCRVVAEREAFAVAVDKEPWDFVFSGYGLYQYIQPVMDRPDSTFPGGKKPLVALMVDWGIDHDIPDVRLVPLPMQSLSIADVLNGVSDRKDSYEGMEEFAGPRFIAPKARLLLVDDIATNLKIAGGLLSPYQAVVDTCMSGEEAVELVKRRQYDMVFMDHMMPEMDGIEALTRIRSWEAEQGKDYRQLPIVALTANAISGMREMFLEQGFNDFLTKPIDVFKLDEIMGMWIPLPKQQKPEARCEEPDSGNDGAKPVISGLDVEAGIAMTGGTLRGYRQVLSLFCKDAKERLPLLHNPPEEGGLPLFTTQVHALKSAAASIGAAKLSALAGRLETAGKAADMAFITGVLPAFTGELTVLTEKITAALEAAGLPAEDGKSSVSGRPAPPLNRALLGELLDALNAQKAEDIDRILEELGGVAAGKARERLEQISDAVLMAEFERAAVLVESLPGEALPV